jgi:hypothetical protein
MKGGDGCKGGCVTATPDVCELEGEKARVESAPGACEEREGGDLLDPRRRFPVVADAPEHNWGGEAYDGGVTDAAAVGPFGNGSIPRRLRMDKFVLMREQIAGLRGGLAKWQRRSAELADEVVRLGG